MPEWIALIPAASPAGSPAVSLAASPPESPAANLAERVANESKAWYRSKNENSVFFLTEQRPLLARKMKKYDT
jgi:hypothetical protein